MEALSHAEGLKEFVKSSRVGNKDSLAWCCSNNRGRFLALTEYRGGGRRGCILIPEGREGMGWSGFALELRKALEFFHSFVSAGAECCRIGRFKVVLIR